MAKGLRRVRAPGLPPSPKLEFDEEGRRAKVSCRHPTWEGREWAYFVVRVVVFLLGVWSLVWVLRSVAWREPSLPDLAARVVGWLIAFAVLRPVVAVLLKTVLVGFLERTLLATTTRVWFTTQAIGFRSRWYDHPVVVSRFHEGRPVNIRFILQPDRRAAAYDASLSWRNKQPRDHLRDSQLLCLLVSTGDPRSPGDKRQHADGQRVIPITELSSGRGASFTIVAATAASITGPEPETPKPAQANDPIDIDHAS